jgi:hypothetical protein
MNREYADTLDHTDPEDKSRYWYRVVEAYTNLDLTLPSDRILAISGIAARFQKLLKDDYCAGLWRSRLATEILWVRTHFIQDPDRSEYRRLDLQRRPAEYQGPSWSWVSVNGPVGLSYLRIDHREPRFGDDHFEIFDCQIQFKDKLQEFSSQTNQFGAVKSGTLAVKGRLQQAQWIRNPLMMYSSQRGVIRKHSAGDEGALMGLEMRADAIEDEFSTTDVKFIPIFLLKVTRRPFTAGLILRHVRDSLYSRLGLFKFSLYYMDEIYEKPGENFGHRELRFQQELDWLDKGEVQTITII